MIKKALSYLTGPLQRLLDFRGRSNRKEFWLYTLWAIPLWYILFFVLFAGGIATFGDNLSSGAQQGLGWLLLFILTPLMLLVGLGLFLAICARRLHDQNTSAWWLLLLLLPYLGLFIIGILMLFPGTKGENRFGLPPL